MRDWALRVLRKHIFLNDIKLSLGRSRTATAHLMIHAATLVPFSFSNCILNFQFFLWLPPSRFLFGLSENLSWDNVRVCLSFARIVPFHNILESLIYDGANLNLVSHCKAKRISMIHNNNLHEYMEAGGECCWPGLLGNGKGPVIAALYFLIWLVLCIPMAGMTRRGSLWSLFKETFLGGNRS